MFIGRIFSLFVVLCGAKGLKILGIFPVVSHSHYTIGYTLLKDLALRGHEVTMITPHTPKEEVKNFTTVVMTGVVEEWDRILKEDNPIDFHFRPAVFDIFFVESLGLKVIEQTLGHADVQKLLKSDHKFDVVLLEHFVVQGLMAVAPHFNAQCVLVSALGPSTWSNHLLGNPELPSYMPGVIAEIPVHTTFWRRLYNFLIYLGHKTFVHLYIYPRQNAIVQEYLPNAPHIRDYMYNASLAIYNSHPVFSKPMPMLPNMVEIGGFHVKPPQKLPLDLQRILDGAKNGVIYFSLGSYVQSKDVPLALRGEILRALSKLKEIILWKFEDDLPDRPVNVVVRKWFPQSDVLAHPNVKLFITHGGLLSTIESLHRGVPVVGIPVFGDQRMNMVNAVSRGHGLMLPLGEVSEVALSRAIREVLENPKYSANVKAASKILKDQQLDPIDKAEYWIEYVVKHNGARHLRSDALELTWYQHASLDVILFLTVVTVVLFIIVYKILGRLLGRRNASKVKTN